MEWIQASKKQKEINQEATAVQPRGGDGSTWDGRNRSEEDMGRVNYMARGDQRLG